jgi:hypothetical protein
MTVAIVENMIGQIEMEADMVEVIALQAVMDLMIRCLMAFVDEVPMLLFQLNSPLHQY